jgi:hypothetical protein
MSHLPLRLTGWHFPVSALAGAALLLSAGVQAGGDRGLIAYGVLNTIVAFDKALPLIGLGVAIAQLSIRQAVVGMCLFAAGAVIGWLGKDWLIWTVLTGADSAKYLVYITFIGPFCCVLAALALALPLRVRAYLMPVPAVVGGMTMGFATALEDPSLGDWQYAFGTAAVMLWLIGGPSLALRWLNPRWLRIGGRIFASWLVAIGVMLGASKSLNMHRADTVPPPSPPSSAEFGPDL